jgi:hypothetical protein
LQQSPAPSPTPGGSVIAFPALRRRHCRTIQSKLFKPEMPLPFRRKNGQRQRATHKHLRFAKLVPKAARGVFSDTAAGIAAVSILPDFCLISGYYPSIRQAIRPSRCTEAAPAKRVVQAGQARVIHRGSSRRWINWPERWTESSASRRVLPDARRPTPCCAICCSRQRFISGRAGLAGATLAH